MSDIAEKLKRELSQLPSRDRAELARYLMDTSDDDADGDNADAAFDAELTRRAQEIRSGKAVGIPAEQVFKEMREKYT